MKIPYEKYEGEYIESKGTDDDYMAIVREVVKALPLPERRIFIMYTEMGTYSSVAKALHCSVPTVSKKVHQIRDKIKSRLNDIH